jgi:hypothetical protein
MSATRKGPRKCSERELAKVGVEIIDEGACWLRCVKCGQKWGVNIPSSSRGEHLCKGYWKCPNGCNSED